MAETALREKCGIDVCIEIIRTTGDETSAKNLSGRKGIFTAELERALLDRRIDLAVHSAKDLPSEMNCALGIAAVLPRGPVEDLLIMKRRSVSSFGTIATGSIRRERQLRWLKKPKEIVDLRGNVPTRLRKFAQSDWDAIILARAGLERLGLSVPKFVFEGHEFFAQVLQVDQFVPAGGQGIIALQTRRKEASFVSRIDHRDTHLCLQAEREFLRLLQGDCSLPVGAHARFVNGEMELFVQLFDEGDTPRMAKARGSNPLKIAKEVFKKIAQDRV